MNRKNRNYRTALFFLSFLTLEQTHALYSVCVVSKVIAGKEKSL
jgi:hypothetical protein